MRPGVFDEFQRTAASQAFEIQHCSWKIWVGQGRVFHAKARRRKEGAKGVRQLFRHCDTGPDPGKATQTFVLAGLLRRSASRNDGDVMTIKLHSSFAVHPGKWLPAFPNVHLTSLKAKIPTHDVMFQS